MCQFLILVGLLEYLCFKCAVQASQWHLLMCSCVVSVRETLHLSILWAPLLLKCQQDVSPTAVERTMLPEKIRKAWISTSLCVRPVALRSIKRDAPWLCIWTRSHLITKGQSASHYPQSTLGRDDFHLTWSINENAIILYFLRNVSIFDMYPIMGWDIDHLCAMFVFLNKYSSCSLLHDDNYEVFCFLLQNVL